MLTAVEVYVFLLHRRQYTMFATWNNYAIAICQGRPHPRITGFIRRWHMLFLFVVFRVTKSKQVLIIFEKPFSITLEMCFDVVSFEGSCRLRNSICIITKRLRNCQIALVWADYMSFNYISTKHSTASKRTLVKFFWLVRWFLIYSAYIIYIDDWFARNHYYQHIILFKQTYNIHT